MYENPNSLNSVDYLWVYYNFNLFLNQLNAFKNVNGKSNYVLEGRFSDDNQCLIELLVCLITRKGFIKLVLLKDLKYILKAVLKYWI